MPASKRRTAKTKKPATQSIRPDAEAMAEQLACRMPFVHFPAGVKFSAWQFWRALKSQAQRGLPDKGSSGPFAVLRNAHVFAYAGPCCFAEADDCGDVAAYFEPEIDEIAGEASPFDSGALEDPDPRLQPWASMAEDARWKFLREQTVSLAEWRTELFEWLRHCYRDPTRYIDTMEDRFAAGLPDRSRPTELLDHNGPEGLRRYAGGRCGDRRAWTWEARFSDELPFERIALLHVPLHHLEGAHKACRQAKLVGNASTRVRPLPVGEAASPDALYRHSSTVLEELL